MFSFENLEVYKKAYRANRIVYKFLKQNNKVLPFARNQLGRASLSIMLNIAEGSAKFSSRDKRNYYVTARASAFECCALVSFLCDEDELPRQLKEELYGYYEQLSKILFTMVRNLENNIG